MIRTSMDAEITTIPIQCVYGSDIWSPLDNLYGDHIKWLLHYIMSTDFIHPLDGSDYLVPLEQQPCKLGMVELSYTSPFLFCINRRSLMIGNLFCSTYNAQALNNTDNGSYVPSVCTPTIR